MNIKLTKSKLSEVFNAVSKAFPLTEGMLKWALVTLETGTGAYGTFIDAALSPHNNDVQYGDGPSIAVDATGGMDSDGTTYAEGTVSWVTTRAHTVKFAVWFDDELDDWTVDEVELGEDKSECFYSVLQDAIKPFIA